MSTEFTWHILCGNVIYIAVDKFSFITLWDTYNGLLTKTQQEITDLYFNMYLTVSEIAAEKNVSRQAVSDCLKGCKAQLEEYEEKLRFCRRNIGVKKWIEEFASARPEFKEETDKLGAIIRGEV